MRYFLIVFFLSFVGFAYAAEPVAPPSKYDLCLKEHPGWSHVWKCHKDKTVPPEVRAKKKHKGWFFYKKDQK